MAKTLNVEQAVKEMIARQGLLDESEVTPNASLIEDCNIDSLDLVELCMTIEESFDFDFEVSPQEADKWLTVQDVIDFIKRKTGGKE